MKNKPFDYITSSMVLSHDCSRKYYYEYAEGGNQSDPQQIWSSVVLFTIVLPESSSTAGKLTEIFLEKWDNIGEVVYCRNDSHKSLKKIGLSLIDQVKRTKIYQRVVSIEKAYKTELPDGTVFKGKVDLIYDNGKEEVLLDWKTSSSLFLDHKPDLDDQLTAYSMLTRIPKVAYGVLLKRKNLELKFYHAQRTQQDYLDYQLKVMKVVSDIESGFFYQKPSLYCSFCPFTPLCRNQKEKIAVELKRVLVEDRYEGIDCEEVLACPA